MPGPASYRRHKGWRLRERIRESAPNDRGERAGLQLVRMAIEQTCPAGVLPSEDAVLLLYGPGLSTRAKRWRKRSLKRSKG